MESCNRETAWAPIPLEKREDNCKISLQALSTKYRQASVNCSSSSYCCLQLLLHAVSSSPWPQLDVVTLPVAAGALGARSNPCHIHKLWDQLWNFQTKYNAISCHIQTQKCLQIQAFPPVSISGFQVLTITLQKSGKSHISREVNWHTCPADKVGCWVKNTIPATWNPASRFLARASMELQKVPHSLAVATTSRSTNFAIYTMPE